LQLCAPGIELLWFCNTGTPDAQTGNGHITHTNYRDILTIESGKRGDKPCIRRLRITV